ncbi:7-cyano-7-deazaguanine synthase QueC [Nosocomiicoccus sp. HMSC09A07]|uniref:7-cyano-7-deazaguanine synthase QueC n=1 Tax=Nosocomiicoccus sp. HMSC09A07 TaxID=1581145 RepID=UPI0008A34952|nr:7-cyano-7-deazaguanine synthase QueC [Nosocomiicoccus sp. HMSC09A07]OFS63892.1 7-cyano-7-deazaguanine synthase QueC [Nosocomiicoccus sp. HMSC09A07]
MSKALIVFSGGQDSTTCLAYALKHYDEVETITFHYNQRHAEEVEIAQKIAKDFNVKNTCIDVSLINDLTENALTRDIDIKSDGDVPNTFVPGRNILFFNIASIAAYQIGADTIVTGVSETDFSGYPDCRSDFVTALEHAIHLGLDRHIKIDTLLMDKDKSEVWEMADELGVFDYVKNETLTCYNGIKGSGCGECPACILRNEGLEEYEKRKFN